MVDKLHPICVRCGDLATRNQRLIGGAESYEARRPYHEVRRVDRGQVEMAVG